MEQYNVVGMSCAACSARVEKAVLGVEGVTSCSVSLLTNSMAVEGRASEEAIIAAVKKAGYGATKKGAEQKSKSSQTDTLADRETPALVRRLVFSLAFLLLLMYLSMGHVLWGFPVPAFLANSASMCYRNGNKSEILYKRSERAYTPLAEYGHAGCPRLGGFVRL